MTSNAIAVVKDFIEDTWNSSNPDSVDAFLSDDYVDHSYEPPNAAGLKNQIAALSSAFPDHKTHIEDVLQDGDRIMLRMRLTGTHGGEFRSIAPTGRKIDVRAARWFRLNPHGKIAEHWALLDTATLLRQISGGH